ncbi:MAG: hypothetical protein ACE5F1_13915, partial [Planctomycetota bacterium]
LFTWSLEILVLDPDGHPLPGVGLGLRGQQQKSTDGKIGGSSHPGAMTDADGLAVFEGVLHGRFTVRTQGGRDRRFVMPITEILVDSSSPRRIRLQAIPAIKLAGTVRYEAKDLSADEAAHARKKMPRWLRFRAKGRQEWTRIEQKPEGSSFTVSGLAPGTYEVSTWGGTIGWAREGLEVSGSRTGVKILLVPAKGALDEFRKEREAKQNKGKKEGSKK